MKYRAVLLVCLLLTVPLGLIVRFAPDPIPAEAGDFLGSVIYEVFWIQLWGFLYPQARLWQVAAWVCGLTCGIEVLQLWQPDWLQNIRATVPGRLVLGNSFNWSDFPAYFVGSAAGWLWMRWLHKHFTLYK